MVTKNRQGRVPDSESLLQRIKRVTGTTMGDKAREEAQELVYDSWETADSDKEYALLAKAVELDPYNVDAWLGMLQYDPIQGEEKITLLRHLVALGEKSLGEKAFREAKGIFWGLLETRPYMRARFELALSLKKAGRLEESMVEHEGMLELNPNDNQGIRYGLLALYLELGNLAGAKRLFEKYKERTFSSMFAWGFVLLRYLAGDISGAGKALRQARKQNAHAEAYFSGKKRLPKRIPDRYSMGSVEEAVIAWEIMAPAWEKYPEAQGWLRSQASKRSGGEKKGEDTGQ
jgi:tetratricopeptide (TPR) repeat protein